jgi:hypothetical protein
MRTIAAILLLAVAGLSTAFAQQAQQDPAPTPQISFSMDHGRAADAAAAAAQAAAAASAKAAAIATGQPLGPSQNTNFSVNSDNVIHAAPPLTSEQQKGEEDGRAAWQARCRPAIVEDRDGIRRTTYAEPDCDLSRFNTAGK